MKLNLRRRKVIGVEAVDDLVEGVADFSGQRQELQSETVTGLAHDVGAVAHVDQLVMQLEFHGDIDFITDLDGTRIGKHTNATGAPVKNRKGCAIDNADAFIGITAREGATRNMIVAAAIITDGIETERCFNFVEHAR
jgi:hypothetical protein